MTRRSALLLASALWADERADLMGLLTPLAAALSNGVADDFLRRLPDDSPNLRELSDNIRTLTAQAEVTSSIEVLGISGQNAETDWLMDIRTRATPQRVERRRSKVTVTLRDGALYSLEPASAFRPLAMR